MRPPIEQTFSTLPLAVPSANAIQLAAAYGVNNFIQSIAICNFSANANSVFLGGNNSVTTTSGYEIQPGSGPIFQIQQTRELYEAETPLQNLVQLANCDTKPADISIPLIVWNPSNMWIIAATAPTNIVVMIFNNVYS